MATAPDPADTMSAAGAGIRNVIVATALGSLLGWGAVAALAEHREQQAREQIVEPGDRVRHAIAGLRADGVYVAPDGRSMLSEAAERDVEALVAEATVPVRIIVWTPTHNAGADTLTVRRQLEREFSDEPAVFFLWEGPQSGGTFTTGAYGFVDGFGSSSDFVGAAQDTLPLAIEAAQHVDSHSGGFDYWGGPGGGSAAGLFLAAGSIGAILTLIGLGRLLAGRRFGLPGRWIWTTEEK